jgi:hypothetical protein
VYLSSCRGKLWHDKPAALGPLRVRQTLAGCCTCCCTMRTVLCQNAALVYSTYVCTVLCYCCQLISTGVTQYRRTVARQALQLQDQITLCALQPVSAAPAMSYHCILLCSVFDRLQDWAVPQAWFLHFYALGSCCNAVVLLLYCLSSPPSSTATPVVSAS